MTALGNKRPAAAAVQFIIGDIYNGSITNSNVGGTGNANNITPGLTSFAKGFELLATNVADQAFYDSGQTADPSRCHPGTREAILADLERWAEHPERDYPIKWVKGSAGVGKTVIVRTIAEWLAKRKQLLASFFFWRSGQGCNTAEYFVATIAYQICQLLPSCKPLIAQVVEEDPKIFNRTMEVQLDRLIVNPIASVCDEGRLDTYGALVIVVDGLDECLNAGTQTQDADKQREILLAMHQAILYLQARAVPFRVTLLIASRPERHIQGVFDTALQRDTSFIMLNESHDATDDIRRYYIDKFRLVRDHHPLRHHLPSSEWPTEDELESLVRRASGQFIYPSTVMQFINAPRKNPSSQLDVVLARKDHDGIQPLGKMDLLYRTLFEQIDKDDWPATRQLLGLLLSDAEFYTRSHPPTFWDRFFGWPPGEVERLLWACDSVLSIQQGDLNPYLHHFFHFYHASLQEFLLDPARSGPFSIDLSVTHEEIAVLCIRHLSTSDGNISMYLYLRMTNWLANVKLTPILKEAFIKGGVDGVYPPNLQSPYPMLLVAIETCKDTSMDSELDGLYREKHDLYLGLLEEAVMEYVDCKADVSAYLVVLAANSQLGPRERGFFLGSAWGKDTPDEVIQLDRKGLALFNNGLVSVYADKSFANGLSSVLDKMPSKGSIFARGASVFLQRMHLHAWSESDDFVHALSCMDLLEYLLGHAAPLHSLEKCIQEYPFPDIHRADSGWNSIICRIEEVLAEYVARVEALHS